MIVIYWFTEGLKGMAIIGGAVLALGSLVGIGVALARKWRISKLWYIHRLLPKSRVVSICSCQCLLMYDKSFFLLLSISNSFNHHHSFHPSQGADFAKVMRFKWFAKIKSSRKNILFITENNKNKCYASYVITQLLCNHLNVCGCWNPFLKPISWRRCFFWQLWWMAKPLLWKFVFLDRHCVSGYRKCISL